MDLILLRHGKAENGNPAGDFSRELLTRGREQARRAARILEAAEKLPEIVLTSPLTRARQTADEFCTTAGLPGPIIQGWLACGMTPEAAMTELSAFHDFNKILIVGHEPDFSSFIEWMLGTSNGAVEMKKATLAGLQISPPQQFGLLKFLIPPKLADEE